MKQKKQKRKNKRQKKVKKKKKKKPCLRLFAGAGPHGRGNRGRRRGGRPRRPPPRQTRRCAAWSPAAPRPLFFLSRAGNFFAFLATFLWQKYLRQINLWLTNLQQNNFREEISINRNPTYLLNLNSTLKRCVCHCSSLPTLLSRSRNLLPRSRNQLPRSNAPLTLSPSPLSHKAPQIMKPRPPKHSSSLLPSKP